MVVVMQEGSSDEQIQHVIDRLTALGFDVHRSTGESHTVLGAVGVKADFDSRSLELIDGVREVVRITQPYKLVSRAFRPAGTIVELPLGVKIGGPEVVVAAGPCAVESKEQMTASPKAFRSTVPKFYVVARTSRAHLPTAFRDSANRA